MTDKKITSATQITQTKKEKTVELYRQLRGHISNVCQTVGIERKTFYNWMEADPEFLFAIKEAEMELNDDLREVLVNKAGEGSTAELIFYLKKRHPDFKDQPQTLVQVNNYKESVSKLFEDELPK